MSLRAESRAHRSSPRPRSPKQRSPVPAACVDRRIPSPRTMPPPGRPTRPVSQRSSIDLPRIVEGALVELFRRTDEIWAAELGEYAVERARVALFIGNAA